MVKNSSGGKIEIGEACCICSCYSPIRYYEKELMVAILTKPDKAMTK